ncbi:MAG: hypothetical protein K2Q14_08915 [Gammaproteobacteria bacterium]|nr:hypothetical protein [Gammaproteobacteria bacterium]
MKKLIEIKRNSDGSVMKFKMEPCQEEGELNFMDCNDQVKKKGEWNFTDCNDQVKYKVENNNRMWSNKKPKSIAFEIAPPQKEGEWNFIDYNDQVKYEVENKNCMWSDKQPQGEEKNSLEKMDINFICN